MKKTVDRSKLFNKPELKDRGWTNGLIASFLSKHDDTRDNPFYKVSGPMLLYKISKVKRIERTEKFAAAKVKATKRKDSSEKSAVRAVATKRELLKKWAENLPTAKIPEMSGEELINLACEHYNDHHADYNEHHGTDKYASSHDSDEFLARISVNFLRTLRTRQSRSSPYHRLSDYDLRLRQTSGRVGTATACAIIKNKVLDAIAHQYPYLSDECEEQKVDPEVAESEKSDERAWRAIW